MEILDIRVLEMSDVERGADGLPTAWPILRAGDNVVTRSQAMPINLRLTRKDLQGMVDYHRTKGAKIPLDCQHVVSNLAGKMGIDEAELLRRLPRYSGVAGFGSLELRDDALYLADVEYLPIGREVMSAGQYRYFSPSLRGLDGKSPLRCTSVALTNEPCLNGLASLAAAEDVELDEVVTPEMVMKVQMSLEVKQELKQDKEAIMSEQEKKVELSVEEQSLLEVVREVLGEDVTPENLRSLLAALKTRADSGAELAEKVKRLECAEEARALAAVRKEALDKGKLTHAMLERPYFKKMTSVELSEYCKAVDDGAAVPVGVLELGEVRGHEEKSKNEPMTVSEAIAASPVSEMK